MLKVISGDFARKSLAQPPSNITRPVSEKARGAIFNMLGQNIVGAHVLDLYAGSGALGIEALSRGAKSVDFVERNTRAVGVLQSNLDLVGVPHEDCQVFPRRVDLFLKHIKAEYDVILMDPPYANFDIAIVEQAGHLLQCPGVLVLSTSSKSEVVAPAGLELFRQKTYGDSMVTVLTKS